MNSDDTETFCSCFGGAAWIAFCLFIILIVLKWLVGFLGL